MSDGPWPLFGGWTPAYEGDPCRGGHPPMSVTQGACGRCGRAVDLRRCLCGEESHRGGLSRSMCPNRMRLDQRDAEDHAALLRVDLTEARAALWIHHDRAITPYSAWHHEQEHESEDDRCDPDRCFEETSICNGCGTRGCSERAIPVLRTLVEALTPDLSAER